MYTQSQDDNSTHSMTAGAGARRPREPNRLKSWICHAVVVVVVVVVVAVAVVVVQTGVLGILALVSLAIARTDQALPTVRPLGLYHLQMITWTTGITLNGSQFRQGRAVYFPPRHLEHRRSQLRHRKPRKPGAFQHFFGQKRDCAEST